MSVDPADALAAMMQPDGSWTAITSDRRDEWSYTSALQAAVEEMQPDTGPSGPVDTD